MEVGVGVFGLNSYRLIFHIDMKGVPVHGQV